MLWCSFAYILITWLYEHSLLDSKIVLYRLDCINIMHYTE
uniref:Uncharacterized protein n=1 Tax=Arundo donax TaxID=35708 RepID=A0A0A9ALN7_ARUDO